MKSVGSQQFGRRSGLWACSCGGSSDDGRSERVNEGVDCGVKRALSFVSSYPMLLDVALSGTMCSGVSGTVPRVPAVERQGSPEMVGFKWVDGLTSHPPHMPSFQLISSDAALCNWPALGWLIRRSPGGKACLHLFKPLFAERIP
jgi:hypothetical protein